MRASLRTLLLAAASLLALAATPAVQAQASWVAFSGQGQPPMPLLLDDLDGKPVDLASLKGQVVLVNFWATWCDGCKAEIPALNRLQQRFKDRKLRILGVNINEGKARIKQFTQRIPVQYTILRDADSVAMKAWHVRIMPTTFLIDKQGRLRYELAGEADWDDPTIQAPVLDLLK
ncbi:alkyl hydroperoxide reductase/ Thiol specific antioxidant/ Mal allergen [Oxalobacteraceae bacterium IMCC9480]|nr:alkyl hydroperoxide reductase/ Thiol specific antioxidant/ Mal allergen [Oxalobacteraceae bacterium IMCC9480]NDP60475.1 TlpA family protein disulfide reductase [Oxalobacteraceae bacterium]